MASKAAAFPVAYCVDSSKLATAAFSGLNPPSAMSRTSLYILMYTSSLALEASVTNDLAAFAIPACSSVAVPAATALYASRIFGTPASRFASYSAFASAICCSRACAFACASASAAAFEASATAASGASASGLASKYASACAAEMVAAPSRATLNASGSLISRISPASMPRCSSA